MGQLSLKNVTKTFGDFQVVKGVSLDVSEGEFVVFVGPSGCGKSTLLRMIAGLEHTSGGDIVIDGKRVNDLPPVKRGIAMVFQRYAIYPHMSVYENIAFPLRVEKAPEDVIRKKVMDAAAILHLNERLSQRPGQLSGGQRQRVAIGRAIVREPEIFLFDEPLSNLDAALRADMRIELTRLHKQLGATMIYVTHDQIEAMTLADRIVVLRKGRVEQVDTPLNLFNRPANLFVAGFIGAPNMNFFTSEAAGGLAALPGGLSLPVAATGPVTLGIRPQHLRLTGDQSAIPAQIILVEALGSETVLHATAEGGVPIVAVLPGQPSLARGQAIRLAFDPAAVHPFDAQGQRIG